jgi:hypothetical protein
MIADMSERLNLNNAQPTLAIGKYLTKLWVCSNGAGAVQILAAATEARPDELDTALIRVTDKKGGSSENMHAEMVIVNNVCRAHNLKYKTDLTGKLVIACAPNKPVCKDCCGWMARHGIPHGETCGDRSAQGWKHPMTKSGFRGDGPQIQYVKGPGTKGADNKLLKSQ